MNNLRYRFRFSIKETIICWVLVILASPTLSAQTLKYEAYLKDLRIGEMTAVKEVNDEAERISVKGSYEFFGDSLINLKFESKSAYMDGILKESEASFSFNDGMPLITITHLIEGSYALERSWNNVIEPLLQSELYGTDLLYFEAPGKIEKVYDIYNGFQMNVEKEDDLSYVVILGGKRHRFQYQNGILSQFTNSFGVYTITFRLVK